MRDGHCGWEIKVWLLMGFTFLISFFLLSLGGQVFEGNSSRFG